MESEKQNLINKLTYLTKVIILSFVLIALTPLILKNIYDWHIRIVFDLPEITYLQAWAVWVFYLVIRGFENVHLQINQLLSNCKMNWVWQLSLWFFAWVLTWFI